MHNFSTHKIGNGTYFQVTQTANFSILTMTNNDGNIIRSESYLLYCTETQPSVFAITDVGYMGPLEYFKVPLTRVMVDDTYTSTYIEVMCSRPLFVSFGCH